MNGKNYKNMLIILLVAVSFIIGFGSYFTKTNGVQTDRYYLQSSAGAVVFEHQKHADDVGNCAECHHAMLKSDETIPCEDCHDDDFNQSDFEHSDMKEIESHTCTTCHQVNELVKTQNCRNCHNTEHEEKQNVVLCQECHEEAFEEDLLTHDELQDLEGHSCDGCHYSRAIHNIYHEQCSACHIVDDEEKKFTTHEGKIKCEACHLK